jgi:hypothetical protein
MADMKGFNANEVEPADFDALPAGKYLAMITDSEMKQTSAGTGRYLQLTFQVLEGPCRNRRVWARLNLENQNAQAVQIARGELSAICRAVGVMTPKDSCELHNLPLIISVKCSKRKDTGEMENRIASYARKDAVAQPQQAAANGAPPWKR